MTGQAGGLFSNLISSVAILIVAAVFVSGGSQRLEEKRHTDRPQWVYPLFFGVLGGIFGIYGNLSGTVVNGALITIRDIGPMLAGFSSGPLGGLIAGGIAGIHRLTMGGVTAQPCIVATCLIGLLSGGMSAHFHNKLVRPHWAFCFAALMEGMHLVINLIMIRPVSTAVGIIRPIAVPFILINSIGFMLLISIIDYLDIQRKKEIERNRLKSDLEAAAVIQRSLLPPVSDRFPGRREIALSTYMGPARDVGGDFYDFFFIDKDIMGFLIADVSGKGIPAAIFMANAKQTLQNTMRDMRDTEEMDDLSDAVFMSNNSLCENNSAEMFVTAWIGAIDLRRGVVKFVNAGHNPPVLITGGTPKYVKLRGGFVLGGMEDLPFMENELRLKKGDKLFLYTDGVTEAENSSHELYGEDRLEKVITDAASEDVGKIIERVRADMDVFVDGHTQFDDITMMCLEYRGSGEEKETGAKD